MVEKFFLEKTMSKFKNLRIAIIGDGFLKNNIVEDALRKKLGKYTDLQFIHGFVNWPEEPFISGEEVQEYVGKEEDVCKVAKDADIIITQLAPITSLVIDNCKKLRLIGCCRGGPVNVNVDAATEKGIPVLNTPGRNATACAEFTIGIILCLLKNIIPAHIDLKKGIWRGDFYQFDKCAEEIAGKNIGIIGFGEVGRKICNILLSFEAKVFVYDPYIKEERIRKCGALPADLKSLLKKSHIVTINARLTSSNYKLIGKKELDLMQPGSYLINSARGKLLDYEALYQALKKGKLAGAALDTFDPEPPSRENSLLKLKNVLLTPHIAGASKDAALRGIKILVDGIDRYLKGEVPENCINPVVFEFKKKT